MGADNQRRPISKPLIHRLPRLDCLGPVNVLRRAPFGVGELHGMMQEIARNQRCLILTLDMDAGVARCVAW